MVSAEKRRFATFRIVQPVAASQTNMEFRQDAGQTHGPQTEIRRRAPDAAGSSRFQVLQNCQQQAKVALVRLARRQQLLRNLGQIIQGDRRAVISQQAKLGTNQLTGIQVHQLPRFPLEIRHLHLREPLQPRSEVAFRTPGALGDATQLAQVPRQETDHQIRFFERVGLQNDGFAHTSGHIRDMAETSRVARRGNVVGAPVILRTRQECSRPGRRGAEQITPS